MWIINVSVSIEYWAWICELNKSKWLHKLVISAENWLMSSQSVITIELRHVLSQITHSGLIKIAGHSGLNFGRFYFLDYRLITRTFCDTLAAKNVLSLRPLIHHEGRLLSAEDGVYERCDIFFSSSSSCCFEVYIVVIALMKLAMMKRQWI